MGSPPFLTGSEFEVHMPLHALSEDDLRSYCRKTIEALERWLRCLIDEELSESYGKDFLEATIETGDKLIAKKIRDSIGKRYKSQPEKYSRLIDAAMLPDEIGILCNPNLFNKNFKSGLEAAFPNGAAEARTFLSRFVPTRHKLSHANSISVRQAEQVICYSHDVIDSLKAYYLEKNLDMQYNVPTVVRLTDSLGNEVYLDQNRTDYLGAVLVKFQHDPDSFLHPGERLSIEVEIDPSFDAGEYEISWDHHRSDGDTQHNHDSRITIDLQNRHVRNEFIVWCRIKSNKDWHRQGLHDDQVGIIYRILPPA